MVADAASLEVADQMSLLPVTNKGGLNARDRTNNGAGIVGHALDTHFVLYRAEKGGWGVAVSQMGCRRDLVLTLQGR